MPRRCFLRPALIGWLAVGLSGLVAQGVQKNILLIIADDYGADSSSLYNSTSAGALLPPTPNTTMLAQSGMVFASAYANPLCSPTRACLLTGRHSFRTGVGYALGAAGSSPLAASEFTLPEAFAAAGTGHHLAQFGKWHLATGLNSPFTVGGWTNFAGSIQGAVSSYTNWPKVVNGAQTLNYTNYATSDVVDDAVAWINTRGTNTWFAWVAFNAGHTPLHKPPINLAPSYAALPGTPAHINNNPELYFHAMIEAMDTEIGRLLASVNLAETHIIFIGDNGTTAQTIQPPSPTTHSKGSLYQGGIKVPLVIAGPNVTNPGTTNLTPVHAVDLFATILELAGTNVAVVPTGIAIDSRSFASTLSGVSDLSRRIYAEVFDTNPLTDADGRALQDSRWKLIRFNDGHDEFYDLQTDPNESINLLAGALTAEQQQYRERLQFQLYGYSTNSGPRIATAAWQGGRFSCTLTQGASYALWRCGDLTTTFWTPVTNLGVTTNGSTVTLTDIAPPAGQAFYSAVR
jgi:arylsulfatase B